MNAPHPTISEQIATQADTAASSLYHIDEKTAVTEDGLHLKHVAKIESLTTNLDSRLTARILSWQVSRTIRRDFNKVTTKLFMRGRDSVFKTQAKDLLVEFSVQGEFLKAAAAEYPLPPSDIVAPVEIPLRIVSAEAGLLMRVFRECDGPIAALNHATSTGAISKETKEEIMQPWERAFKDFKSYVIGENRQSSKTAAELGAEGGIS